MEIKKINLTGTYFVHELIVEINNKTVEYIINYASLPNGKRYLQNYCKKRIVKLTTSERKQIKSFIENDFKDCLITESWLSPFEIERKNQEILLKKIWPDYPNSSFRWQYLTGLLKLSCEYLGIDYADNKDNNSVHNPSSLE